MRGLDCEESFQWFQDFHLLLDGWSGNRCGSTRSGLMDPDGIVGVPRMLDEV